MKVLLRNRKTKLFFHGEAEWTPERALARDFRQSGRAVQFVCEHRLTDMEALLTFQDPRYDLCLPIHFHHTPPSSGSRFQPLL